VQIISASFFDFHLPLHQSEFRVSCTRANRHITLENIYMNTCKCIRALINASLKIVRSNTCTHT